MTEYLHFFIDLLQYALCLSEANFFFPVCFDDHLLMLLMEMLNSNSAKHFLTLPEIEY